MPLKVDKIIAGSVETDSLTINGGSLGLPYKVYTAKLSQTGTDDPIATVMENTLGGELVWTRNGSGSYDGTLSGAFAESSKIFFPLFDGSKTITSFKINSDSVIRIGTGLPSDDELNDTPFEIRIYP